MVSDGYLHGVLHDAAPLRYRAGIERLLAVTEPAPHFVVLPAVEALSFPYLHLRLTGMADHPMAVATASGVAAQVFTPDDHPAFTAPPPALGSPSPPAAAGSSGGADRTTEHVRPSDSTADRPPEPAPHEPAPTGSRTAPPLPQASDREGASIRKAMRRGPCKGAPPRRSPRGRAWRPFPATPCDGQKGRAASGSTTTTTAGTATARPRAIASAQARAAHRCSCGPESKRGKERADPSLSRHAAASLDFNHASVRARDHAGTGAATDEYAYRPGSDSTLRAREANRRQSSCCGEGERQSDRLG